MSQKKTKPRKGRKKAKQARGVGAQTTSPTQEDVFPQPKPPTNGSIFEQWAERFGHVLERESDLVGAFVEHGTLIGNAREALIKGVLERMLPSIYEIGTGEVIDAAGNRSNQMDVIIARKDFPALRFADGSAQYLVESVLATIEVKSRLDAEKLKSALGNCYSMGVLVPSYLPRTVRAFVDSLSVPGQMEFRILANGEMQSRKPNSPWEAPTSPIMQKINIVTRPATYIFSFQGYSEDEDAFRTCLGDWLQSTTDSGVHMTLAHVPAVIASKGIAAVRNDNLTNIVGRRWPLMITFAEANQLGVLVRSILTRLKSSVSIAPHTEGLVPTLDRYFTEQRYTGRVLGWVDF